MGTKRDEALELAEDLLTDIELSRTGAVSYARKASRLARLLNDGVEILWLHYEVVGYPEGNNLDQIAWSAAQRSNRVYSKDGKQYARTSSIGQIEESIAAAKLQLGSAADASHQITNTMPTALYTPPPAGNAFERNNLRSQIASNKALLDKVVGSIYVYASTTYQKLRFGSVVETIFEDVRDKVDAQIGGLIPDALPILNTALENSQSNDKAQWKNAANACRDLLIAAADTLRPPGKPKNGISMTKAHYKNRLIDWIKENSSSDTTGDLVSSELQHLGERLDAAADTGNKGAHVSVTQEEANRYLVGTYMLLGDILDIAPPPKTAKKVQHSTDASLVSDSEPKATKETKKPKKKTTKKKK